MPSLLGVTHGGEGGADPQLKTTEIVRGVQEIATCRRSTVPDIGSVQFLRDLQDLRSSGVGDRKSDNYEKITAKLKLEERGFRTVFEDLLRRAVALLDGLAAGVLALNSSSDLPR